MSGSGVGIPVQQNSILTTREGADVLRCEITDSNLLALLPMVDAYLKNATGHNWAEDASVREEAKSAARMLLVLWHENPGMISAGMNSLEFGLRAVLVQLQVIALRYREFFGRNGAGRIELLGAYAGDTVTSVTGLVGVTGSQAASFESVITVDGEIQQSSTSDLSSNIYRVYLTPASEL